MTGLARANSPSVGTVIMASAALLLVIGTSPRPAFGRPPPADLPGAMKSGRLSPVATKSGRLIDRSHRLSRRDAAALENRLAATSLRLGSPIAVVVVDGLHHDTAASAAARAFAELPASPDTRANPILLLVSPRDRAAAIETGKGIAGIVPQIEAQQITTRLAAASGENLSGALVRAIDAIIVSAEATAERRRPAAIDEDLPPAETTPSPVDGGADSATGPADEVASADEVADEVPSTSDGTPTPPAGPARRSRLPAAIGIAALLLLAIALRRRKNLAKAPNKLPPPSPRPPAVRR